MVEIVGLGAWCAIKYSKKYFIRRIITRSAFISTLHSAESQCVIDFCFLGISSGSLVEARRGRFAMNTFL